MQSQYVYVHPWSEIRATWEQAITPSVIPFNGLGLTPAELAKLLADAKTKGAFDELPTITQKQYDKDLFEAKATMAGLGLFGGALLAWIMMRR